MSQLTIFSAESGEMLDHLTEHSMIVELLRRYGVRFEKWKAECHFSIGASAEEVLTAYEGSVQGLMKECGFLTADVVSLSSDHPEKETFRSKFLSEHTHSEDEVRFFVEGEGMFYMHIHGEVLMVLCQRGDLISVPAMTKHWFDMGPNPNFKCIRIFTNPDGWVANFTGDSIAERFPRHEN